MANANMPESIPVEDNAEGPDDIGATPGNVTPDLPAEFHGGDEIAAEVDAMEKRVLSEGSDEVKDAVEDVQDHENPGPNKDVDPDDDVDPDRDEPA